MTSSLPKLGVWGRLAEYAELVKFEHTIFALPFALSAMLLAVPGSQLPSFWTVLWVVLCMVGGRTYAMGLNRLIDARIDGQNPRTQNRSIPAGRVSKQGAWVLILASGLLLVLSVWQLPLICRLLLPLAFLILTIYSYMKLFSPLAHLVLGIALGSSAVGGWLAVTGALAWQPVVFGLAIVFWVAGFDVIYACQDYEFDQTAGLKSIPVALGLQGALQLSRLFHCLTVGLLVGFALGYSVGLFFWFAILMTAGMLVYEHWLIRGDDMTPIRLEKVNEAFFTVNGRISMAVFLLVLADKLF
ncbi:UbiA-like polyprenyltransferase [Vampirovibrio sp.]|uniref:UbiA-like polyprenyltransferase n=1 Tax=Vampirovibrio sp. TaxID=2717857 RepID=UPI0035945F12